MTDDYRPHLANDLLELDTLLADLLPRIAAGTTTVADAHALEVFTLDQWKAAQYAFVEGKKR